MAVTTGFPPFWDNSISYQDTHPGFVWATDMRIYRVLPGQTPPAGTLPSDSTQFTHIDAVHTSTGTEVRGADAASAAAIHNALPGGKGYVADLTTITDGPAGMTGAGYVESIEMPAGSGNYARWVHELDNNKTHLAQGDGVTWSPWQEMSAASPTSVQEFNATTDWGADLGTTYVITIPAATHGIASPTEVEVQQGAVGGPYGPADDLVDSGSPTILANNDITLTVGSVPFDGRFEGRVVIS